MIDLSTGKPMTRRECVKGLGGLAAILAAGQAPAAIVKSMCAARGICCKVASGWKNPYVTDGLVAMWDGEWNAGGGIHDANATIWTDISWNGNDAIRKNEEYPYYWTNNALACDDVSNMNHGCFYCYVNGLSQAIKTNGVTVENVNLECLHYDFLTVRCEYLGRYLRDLGNIFGIRNVAERTWVVKDKNGKRCNSTIITESKLTSFCLGEYNKEYSFSSSWSNLISILGVGDLNGNMDGAGKVGCVRVYNRKLSPEEIAFNYGVDNERFGID